MFEILKTNPLAAAIAIGMHLLIILLMIFGLDWLEKPQQNIPKVNVVQATVIDASKVDAEVKKLKLEDENKKKKEQEAKQKLDDLKKQRQVEEKKLADAAKKRKVEEAKKRKLEKERQIREAKEKKRKEAEAKKQKEEAKRKAAEAEKKKAEEAKRKAAEEKKRKAEAERKRKQAEQAKLEAQMRADMEAERDATEIQLYIAQIGQAVMDNWLRPMGVGDGLKCTIRIRMATGGNVITAQVVQSSGNGAFDRSARAAVLKADPLPVPSGRLFERMREIDFEFDPDGR
jgi:colicin import membrane protein